MTVQATREPVTCACGSILSETYPAAVKRHTETAKHQTWLTDLFDGPADLVVARQPVDLVAARQPDESASAYVTRLESSLGAKYTTFLETDAGQVALKDAADEQTGARKEAHKADMKSKVEAKAATKSKVEPATKAKPIRVVKPTRITNPPLSLGVPPIEVDGVKYLPVLKRDGTPIKFQLGAIDWHCPTCGRRLRAAKCEGEGETSHKAVKSPKGYRVEDRIVK